MGDPLPALNADILCAPSIMGGGEGRERWHVATQSRKCFQTHGRRSGVGLKAVVNVTVTVTASVEGLRLLPDIGSIREASHATYKCLKLFYATIMAQ